MNGGSKLLVIGGVAAGLSAAAKARRCERELEITVVERGETISHALCGLPFLVAGEVSDPGALLSYTPERFERERGVRVLTRHTAVEIVPTQKVVLVDDLEGGGRKRLPFDRLVIAVGAEPRIPLETPPGLRGMFAVRSIDDALALNAWLEREKPSQAAVIGAGMQGLEWVDALRRRGLQVTLFERLTSAAARCDAEIGDLVRERLSAVGVKVEIGAEVTAVESGADGKIKSVITRDGVFPCGVAVVAAGVEPRTELAERAGVRLDPCGAIGVDETMETSVRGIFAAGDCACVRHIVTGASCYQPTGALAVKSGRVAGSNAAGRYAVFPGTLGTQAASIADHELVVTGLNSSEAEQYSRLIADADSKRLLGAQLFGPGGTILRAGLLAAVITSRMPLPELAMLDLPYAPLVSPPWDPIHIAVSELLKKF